MKNKPQSRLVPSLIIFGLLIFFSSDCYCQSYDSLQQKILKLEVAQKDLQLKVSDLEKKQKLTFNGIKIVGSLTVATYFILLAKHNNAIDKGNAGKPPSAVIGAAGCIMLSIGFAY